MKLGHEDARPGGVDADGEEPAAGEGKKHRKEEKGEGEEVKIIKAVKEGGKQPAVKTTLTKNQRKREAQRAREEARVAK